LHIETREEVGGHNRQMLTVREKGRRYRDRLSAQAARLD